jgi:hypothetical protein
LAYHKIGIALPTAIRLAISKKIHSFLPFLIFATYGGVFFKQPI